MNLSEITGKVFARMSHKSFAPSKTLIYEL